MKRKTWLRIISSYKLKRVKYLVETCIFQIEHMK